MQRKNKYNPTPNDIQSASSGEGKQEIQPSTKTNPIEKCKDREGQLAGININQPSASHCADLISGGKRKNVFGKRVENAQKKTNNEVTKTGRWSRRQ